MKRLVVLLAAAACCSPATVDAAPGAQVWESAYDGGKSDFARDLVIAPDGSTVYVTGRSNLGTWDFATAAFDAGTGAASWTRRYDRGRRDYAVAAAVHPDGTVLYVTGASLIETLDFVTIAYDAATGDVVWVSEYDDPAHRDDEPTSIAVAPGGSIIIVAGWTGNRFRRRQFRTVAISTHDGTVLWTPHMDLGVDLLWHRTSRWRRTGRRRSLQAAAYIAIGGVVTTGGMVRPLPMTWRQGANCGHRP